MTTRNERNAINAVSCPVCGAAPGRKCQSSRIPSANTLGGGWGGCPTMASPHAERRAAAKAACQNAALDALSRCPNGATATEIQSWTYWNHTINRNALAALVADGRVVQTGNVYSLPTNDEIDEPGDCPLGPHGNHMVASDGRCVYCGVVCDDDLDAPAECDGSHDFVNGVCQSCGVSESPAEPASLDSGVIEHDAAAYLNRQHATSRECAEPVSSIAAAVREAGTLATDRDVRDVLFASSRFSPRNGRHNSWYLDETRCERCGRIVDEPGATLCGRCTPSDDDSDADECCVCGGNPSDCECVCECDAATVRAQVLVALDAAPGNRALAFVVCDDCDAEQDAVSDALDALVADATINALTTDESTPRHLREYALPTQENVLAALREYSVPQRIVAPATVRVLDTLVAEGRVVVADGCYSVAADTTRPGFEPTDENHAPRLVLDDDAEHVDQAIVELLVAVPDGMPADDARTALGYRLGTVDRDDFRAALERLMLAGLVSYIHSVDPEPCGRYVAASSAPRARRVAASRYFQRATRSTRKTIRSTDMNTPAPFDAVLVDTVTARLAARRIGRMEAPVFLPRLPADERPRCDVCADDWRIAFGSRARCVAVPRGESAPHAGVFMTARQARRILDAVYGRVS